MTLESMLLDNAEGGYRVLPAGAAYCTGIVAHQGFEVVRVMLDPWLPVEEAYAFVEDYLKRSGRPVKSLCGIEMRLPAPLAPERWSEFNLPYVQQLGKWDLLHGESSGVCRSNIAVAVHPPATASVCAFSHTRPTTSSVATFCLSGAADIDARGTIIADGDTSPPAMQRRARYVINELGSNLAKLGLSWRNARQVAVFHVHEIPDLWGRSLLGRVGEALRNGVLIYRARPPIAGAEVELEARGARQELIVSTR